MATFTHFSNHSIERILQRTKLSCEEIASIIDRGLAVNTGRKPGFNRSHLVFYSIPDDDFFVAIQDDLTGKVVTILTLAYQENLAWRITEQDCTKARDLLCAAEKAGHDQVPHYDKNHQSPTRFIVSGHFYTAAGVQQTKTIKKIKSALFHDDIKEFIANSPIFDNLDALAAKNGIDAKSMFGITVRHGGHGVPIPIDVMHQR
jgi:hypothetical protein